MNQIDDFEIFAGKKIIVDNLIDLCDEIRRRHIRCEGVNPLGTIRFIETEIFKTETDISEDLPKSLGKNRPALKQIEIQALTVLYSICMLIDEYRKEVDKNKEQLINDVRKILSNKDYLKE